MTCGVDGRRLVDALLLAPLLDGLRAVEAVDRDEAAAAATSVGALLTHEAEDVIAVGDGGGVVQLRVLEQANNGACGYYALHSAAVCVRASRVADAALRRRVLRLVRSRASFWRFYARCQRVLLAEAEHHENRTKWPWAARSIREGILERTYLPHLLAHPSAAFAPGTCHYVHYAYGHFANSMVQLQDLHRAFERVRSRPGVEVFMIGVLSHWVAVVANTVQARDGLLVHELLYMDSHNRPVFGVTPADVDAFMFDLVREYERDGKEPPSAWRLGVIRQSRQDSIDGVRDVVRCLRGEADVRQLAMTSMVQRLLVSYLEHGWIGPDAPFPFAAALGDALPDDRWDAYLERLHHWMAHFYPPAVLHRSVLYELREHGLDLVVHAELARLHAWCSFHDEVGRRASAAPAVPADASRPYDHFRAVVAEMRALLHVHLNGRAASL